MEQLRDSGAEKHTTIFLGAGASTTSGLPGWDELVTRLLLSGGVVGTSDSAQLLLSRQDPLMVVEAARAAHGLAWHRKLRKALYEGVVSTEFSPLQQAAVAHALNGDLGDTTLATLNFDNLLEQALEAETGEPAASRSAEAYDDTDPLTVHHLHGVVTPTAVSDVVLTLTEFLDLLSAASSWQLNFVHEAMSRGAFVIAGTSYRDPDVRQWLHAALKDAPSHHAAIALVAREGFRVSKTEYVALEKAISSQWSAVGIRAVLLHDFSDAAQVIRELRHVNDLDYLSPQERAALIWSAHTECFEDLQAEYVAVLQEQALVMKEVLDVEALNMSVWLADGGGKLVRWAAQDRVYSEISALRVVETGYDSPWIAGKALGSDALLIEDLQGDSNRRWKSVLALPIPVLHPTFPVMTSAVLTIGLPGLAEAYAGSELLWGASLSEIGDFWSERISSTSFEV